jgi:pimeloyl-ACP methyl ester carboxylesterase/DNA-binding CsgD family transcriptional regulator
MDQGPSDFTGGAPVGGALESWLDDHEAMTASIMGDAPEVGAGFSEVVSGYAIIRTERLAGAVLDRTGRPLFHNQAFKQLFGEAPPDLDVALDALRTRRARIAAPASGDDRARTSAVIYAPLDQVAGWTLPADVRAALDRPGAAILAMAVAGIGGGDALDDACRAFRLTPLQTRIAAGLVRTGNVRGAAREAGVAYETARTVVADTMRRVGAPRLTSLIERLVRLSFGIWPEGRDGAGVLSDVWGLTTRQATLALRLAEGQTRAEAARASGISESTAKKDLDVAFAALGVRTSAALARAVTEIRALALLTEATHHDVNIGNDFLEPLGLFTRPDGTHVAYSDYGPRGGAPVLVIHSSSTSRPAPMTLVRALQARGFRPLSIDRPGFGLTDTVRDREAHRADPFAGACPDVVALCEHLKLPRLDIVARGGAQVALALAHDRPDLVGRMVLVNPDPPTRRQQQERGPFAAIKAAFLRRPDLIEKLAGLWITSLGRGQVERVMSQGFGACPPDAAVMSNPAMLADYARAYRMFLTGRVAGYVDEQTALTRWSMEPRPGLSHWRVLLGAQDVLHDPAWVLSFWRGALPDTPIEVLADGGRFIALSHADMIADTLANAPAAAPGA